MKLYIWDDPYPVSWGASYLIVAAENLAEARKLAKKAPNGQFSYMRKGVDVDTVKPSRTRSLPYAEYLEWSE